MSNNNSEVRPGQYYKAGQIVPDQPVVDVKVHSSFVPRSSRPPQDKLQKYVGNPFVVAGMIGAAASLAADGIDAHPPQVSADGFFYNRLPDDWSTIAAPIIPSEIIAHIETSLQKLPIQAYEKTVDRFFPATPLVIVREARNSLGLKGASLEDGISGLAIGLTEKLRDPRLSDVKREFIEMQLKALEGNIVFDKTKGLWVKLMLEKIPVDPKDKASVIEKKNAKVEVKYRLHPVILDIDRFDRQTLEKAVNTAKRNILVQVVKAKITGNGAGTGWNEIFEPSEDKPELVITATPVSPEDPTQVLSPPAETIVPAEPTNTIVEPTPTAFSLGETPPSPVYSEPISPPPFTPEAAGGQFPESMQESAELDYYRALQAYYKNKIGDFWTANYDEYKKFLNDFASANGLEVEQKWNGGYDNEYQLVTYLTARDANGHNIVYWMGNSSGSLAYRPDGLANDIVYYPITLRIGTHAEWRYGEDKNIYLYEVDNKTGEVNRVFLPSKADARDSESIKNAWQDIEKPILVNWADGMINGNELGRSSRIDLTENFAMEDGRFTIFSLNPRWPIKIIRVAQVTSSVQEVTWGFILNDKQLMFKILYTKFDVKRPNGDYANFGEKQAKVGEQGTPYLVGFEKPLDPMLFQSNSAFRLVYENLQVDPENKSNIIAFFKDGNIAPEWEIDEEGIVNLAKHIALADYN